MRKIRRVTAALTFLPAVLTVTWLLCAIKTSTIYPFKPAVQWAQLETHLNEKEIPANLPEFAKTTYLMALSAASTSALNLYFMGEDKAALKKFMTRVLELSQSPNLKFQWQEIQSENGYGIYFGHRLLTACTYRLITGETILDPEIETFSSYLKKQSANPANHFIVTPYFAKPNAAVYPADQSAILLALYICDRSRNLRPDRQPLSSFLQDAQRSAVFLKTGLHPSGWNSKYDDIPRGVGMAYEISNLAHLDPEAALKLYRTFRAQMSRTLWLFGGFREWPQLSHYPPDVDSGPVLLETGVAASALSLPAAKLFQDNEMYLRIERTGSLLGGIYTVKGAYNYLLLDGLHFTAHRFFSQNPDIPGLADALNLFAESTLLNARTARPWFDEVIPSF